MTVPTIPADVVALLGRGGLDILTLIALVAWLYRGQKSLPSMPLTLTCLNVGVFATVTAFTYLPGLLTAGLGFGLFAVLQMVQLRSAAFTVKDVAFTFLTIIIGLINALPQLPWPLLISLNTAMILAVAITDTTRGRRSTRDMRLTLEKAYSDPTEARLVLQERLGVAIESLVIQEIDYVRDTTQVKLSYFVDSAQPFPSADEISDRPAASNGTSAALRSTSRATAKTP